MLSKLSRTQLTEIIELAKRVRREGSDAGEIQHGEKADEIALRDALERLSPEARAELIAVMIIGRGDIGWAVSNAVALAKPIEEEYGVDYLMGKLHALWFYLTKGEQMIDAPDGIDRDPVP